MLLGSRRTGALAPDDASGAAAVEMHVDVLRPGRYQPRRSVVEETLAELADSIREQGVLQPLVVREIESDDASGSRAYEIVAGERRWRAAKLAGLSTVPVVVRELDDQSALAVALIENLQREDLNPIDQAQSLSRLANEFGLTHEQAAKAVGRSRASVTNLLRLLELEDEVKDLLASGKLDMGHARALLPLDAERQVALARKTAKKHLSVRQVERAVKQLLSASPEGAAGTPVIDLQARWLQRQIGEELGQKIAIRQGKDGRYTLQIGFEDLAQLEESLRRLIELIARVRETAGPRARDASS